MEKETHRRLDRFSPVFLSGSCLLGGIYYTVVVHHPDSMRLFKAAITVLLRCCGGYVMEIYWYIPRIKQAMSSRTSASPEASNMLAPLLLSVSAQSPRCFRLLLAATRRSVSAKPASLFRHKMKRDQCHFCGDKNDRKLLGSFWEGRGGGWAQRSDD